MDHFFTRMLGIGCLLLALSEAHAADTQVFLKPGGDDQASGRSEAAAVGTLQVAVKQVLALPVDANGARKILILPGTYRAQTTIISDIPDSSPLIITGSTGAGRRPVFDGDGKGGIWLRLDSASGRATRLTIEGIEVTNYVTAILLYGDRRTKDGFNAENVINKNLFRNIGQVAFPQGKPSTAALGLVNSRNNRITENRFLNIRNNTGCGALHAIYLSNYSSGNLIEGNTFDGGCGATVKTRDGSGDNIIKGNRFIDQAEPAFLDSFCDRDTRGDCTKKSAECPSWGNEFIDNTLSRVGPKARQSPVQVTGPDTPAGCTPPPAGSKRLQVVNTRNEDR